MYPKGMVGAGRCVQRRCTKRVLRRCTRHSARTEWRTGVGERDTDFVDQLAETVRLTLGRAVVHSSHTGVEDSIRSKQFRSDHSRLERVFVLLHLRQIPRPDVPGIVSDRSARPGPSEHYRRSRFETRLTVRVRVPSGVGGSTLRQSCGFVCDTYSGCAALCSEVTSGSSMSGLA
jgi:hypothetical protein